MRSFGKADHGITWALSQLPAHTSVKLTPYPKAIGQDDYAILAVLPGFQVQSNSATGTIAGLLRLSGMLKSGKLENITQHLQFRTRNYKTESKHVMDYTDEMWERLCQKLVTHHFNGLVFYAHYHPFENILDYSEYPEATSKPWTANDAYRARFNRLLESAHFYNLTTYIQHYVGHFTERLADAHNIQTGGR